MGSSDTRHWTKEPWVWLLIAIPSTAIVMGVIMLTLAIQSYSGLVVDDYYRQGKQINRVLARDRAAWELGLSVEMQMQSTGQIRLRLQPGSSAINDEVLELQLIHATRPGLDQSIRLRSVGDRQWSGDVVLEGQGRWNLVLQTPQWRLTGSLRHPGSGKASLLPNYFAE